MINQLVNNPTLANQFTQSQLQKIILKADNAYYNTGNPIFTDELFVILKKSNKYFALTAK